MLLWVLLSGCARLQTSGGFGGYETRPDAVQRHEIQLKKKHEKALDLMQSKGDLCRAEQLLREALAIDARFGPAHNTLGTLYLEQGKHYFAAWEFEYARRLMPERVEPINNLGLVYESAGQLDRAIEFFEQAYAEAPLVPQYLGNLLRARVRRGDRTPDMIPLLNELVMLEPRAQWREWAQRQIATGRYPDPEQPLVHFQESETEAIRQFDLPAQSPLTTDPSWEEIQPNQRDMGLDPPQMQDPVQGEGILPEPTGRNGQNQ